MKLQAKLVSAYCVYLLFWRLRLRLSFRENWRRLLLGRQALTKRLRFKRLQALLKALSDWILSNDCRHYQSLCKLSNLAKCYKIVNFLDYTIQLEEIAMSLFFFPQNHKNFSSAKFIVGKWISSHDGIRPINKTSISFSICKPQNREKQ